MSEFNITIPGGQSKRLLTAGKYCPSDIVVTAEGGGGSYVPTEEKDVNFYDYDGTLLYSYTLAEVQALTALPDAPTPPKDFLVFKEWNWTLEQIKEVANCVDVGAVYAPADGCTRAVLNIRNMSVADVTVRLKTWDYNLSDGTLDVDWGDGTVDSFTQASTGSAAKTLQHRYGALGEYVVKFTLHGDNLDLGGNSATALFVGEQYTSQLKELWVGDQTRISQQYTCLANMGLEAVSIGSNAYNAIAVSAFQRCRNLRAFIVPSWVTTLNNYVLRYNVSTRVVSLPYGLTTLGYYWADTCDALHRLCLPPSTAAPRVGPVRCAKKAFLLGNPTKLEGEAFTDWESLDEIDIPNSVTAIGDSVFRRCYRLAALTIPANVSTIGAQAFYDATGLKKLKFLPTKPPTVSNANAFTNVPTNCVVEVPSGSFQLYRTATNYSGIADLMVGV